MSEVDNKLGRALPEARNRDAGFSKNYRDTSAFNLRQWLTDEGAGVFSAMTGAEHDETMALSVETDPELLGRDLLALAGRWEQNAKLDQALALYQLLASHPNWGAPGYSELRKAAQRQMEAIQGQGGMGPRAEFLLRRFARDASDPRMIVPMMAGTAVYSLVRSAAFSRLLASAQSGLWTRGFGARLAAGTLGYLAEVPTFALSSRALRGLGRSAVGHEPGNGQDLAGAALTLGVLKFTGAGSQALLAKIGNPHHPASSFLLSQSSLFLGLMGAHKLEASLGLRPDLPNGTLVTDILASMLSLGVGAHLGRRVLGRGYDRFQAQLELSARTAESRIPGGGIGTGPMLIPAGVGAGEPNSGIGPSRADPFPSEGLGFPQNCQMQKWQEFQNEVEKIRSNPAALSPKARQSLAKLARETTLESGKYKDNPDWHAHLALRDFARLRDLANKLISDLPRLNNETDYLVHTETLEDIVLAQLIVENYSAVFKLLEKPGISFLKAGDGDNFSLKGTVLGSIHIRSSYVMDYTHRKGFEKIYEFSLIPTLRDLVSLAQNYDVFIGIAKGGLYSASVVDLLGLPNFIMEIHAHRRRKVTSRWVDWVPEEQIAGKRVLLLDKDAITGSTVEEAMRMLRPLHPREVGIYFNNGPQKQKFVSFEAPGTIPPGPRISQVPGRMMPSVLPDKAVGRIRAAGVSIHYPGNVAETPLEAAFYAAHERLQTTLGGVRRSLSAFNEDIFPSAANIAPGVHEELTRRLQGYLDLHDSLNPLVPGAGKVRESIANFLRTTAWEFQSVLQSGIRDPRDPDTYFHLAGMLSQARPHEVMVEDFAQARYFPWGVRLAQEKGINLEHIPHAYAPAFRTAQEALRSRNYEIALIVGPEGFAYEPIFRDLGVPTVAINIPEADFGGRRSLKKLDELDALKGKRVLVVEDDIRSGATLQRMLRGIKPHGPFAELGLFLGLPQTRQMGENIPAVFQNVFISDPQPEKDQAAFMEHFSEREKIWKVPKN